MTDALAGTGVIVAVIDSGWDRAQPDERVLPGRAFTRSGTENHHLTSESDADRHGHGTACTDLIMQCAPNVNILPVRVFSDVLETKPADLLAALRWATSQHPHIIHLSLCTRLESARNELYLRCSEAVAGGSVIVAAGTAPTRSCYPAVFDCVIGVDSAPLLDPLAISYTPTASLEFQARGSHSALRWLNGERRAANGSSYAAAVVSGRLAAIIGPEQRPSVAEARELLAELSLGGHAARGSVGLGAGSPLRGYADTRTARGMSRTGFKGQSPS